MNNQNQFKSRAKISTPLGILIIVLVAVAVGILVRQYWVFPEGKGLGKGICGPKARGGNYDGRYCDRSCKIDNDCKFTCGCGAINKNEICHNEGIIYDCVDHEIKCEERKCVEGGEIIFTGVTIATDKTEYKKKVKTGYSCIYGSDCILGETIHLVIENNSDKDILFHAEPEMVIPFNSLYIECFHDGKWELCLHGIAELPADFTSDDWLEGAKQLKSGENFIFDYKIEYTPDWQPYVFEKYRFRLDYAHNLTEEDDWLMREEISGREMTEKKFESAYSNEFSIK